MNKVLKYNTTIINPNQYKYVTKSNNTTIAFTIIMYNFTKFNTIYELGTYYDYYRIQQKKLLIINKKHKVDTICYEN